MAKPILIFDVPNLCHRNFHAFGGSGMQYEGRPTAVIFGFLRDVLKLQQRFVTKDCVFCFDVGKSLREKHFPFYKAKRRANQAVKDQKPLREQISRLQLETLGQIGFKNVYGFEGYEADDIIASVCERLDDNVGIISSDHDLYQLLRVNRFIYQPNKKDTYTEVDLAVDYGVTPEQWPTVKAIAGCSSDEIPGIEGVGEITAARYIAGKLGASTATYKRILHQKQLWEKNLELVRLPYPGCPQFDLVDDKVTVEKWLSTLDSLGMNKLKTMVKDD